MCFGGRSNMVIMIWPLYHSSTQFKTLLHDDRLTKCIFEWNKVVTCLELHPIGSNAEVGRFSRTMCCLKSDWYVITIKRIFRLNFGPPCFKKYFLQFPFLFPAKDVKYQLQWNNSFSVACQGLQFIFVFVSHRTMKISVCEKVDNWTFGPINFS